VDTSIVAHEAAWMVPALIFAVSTLGGLVCGLVFWVINKAISIAYQFREDVNARLDKQDSIQEQHGGILNAIKALLQDEVNKLRSRLWNHDARLSRLEEHNGLGHMRRFDDDPGGK
jgi:hypothetical protein